MNKFIKEGCIDEIVWLFVGDNISKMVKVNVKEFINVYV